MQTHVNVDKFIAGIKDLMRRHGISGGVETRDIRTRDDFFSESRVMYDSSECWYERVWVNKKAWLESKYELRTDFPVGDVDFVSDIVAEWADDHGIPKDVDFDGMTLDQIKEQCPEEFDDLMERIKDEIDDRDYHALEDDLKPLYGVEYPDDEFNELEALGYWTVYFEPRVRDEAIAWKVGLIPFEYDGTSYLALGGCGMDLSPRLDAYQALTVGSVSSDSQFIRQPGYAAYVVGQGVFDEVMEAIKCPPQITVYTW